MKDNSLIPTLAQPASSLTLPIQLAQQAADAVRELLAEAAAANTTRSYASALRYWAGWHAARYGVEFTLPRVGRDSAKNRQSRLQAAVLLGNRLSTSCVAAPKV